jgi:hypothetical protein
MSIKKTHGFILEPLPCGCTVTGDGTLLDPLRAQQCDVHGQVLGPCERCKKQNSARERGNGMANWCESCRELFEIFVQHAIPLIPADGASATARLCALDDIATAARELGLLDEEQG